MLQVNGRGHTKKLCHIDIRRHLDQTRAFTGDNILVLYLQIILTIQGPKAVVRPLRIDVVFVQYALRARSFSRSLLCLPCQALLLSHLPTFLQPSLHFLEATCTELTSTSGAHCGQSQWIPHGNEILTSGDARNHGHPKLRICGSSLKEALHCVDVCLHRSSTRRRTLLRWREGAIVASGIVLLRRTAISRLRSAPLNNIGGMANQCVVVLLGQSLTRHNNVDVAMRNLRVHVHDRSVVVDVAWGKIWQRGPDTAQWKIVVLNECPEE
mmetsp:Transcript_13346/g.31264  ORF Transcript_13346/g.31264 Transcript_13346/m.31264 type:complete len:268 (-) Transcript_13346:4083-4886(-)